MTAIVIPKTCFKPINRNAFVRNNRIPDANLYGMLAGDTNRACRYLTREMFRGHSVLSSIPTPNTSVSGSEQRWRFASVTSPFCRFIRVRAVLAMSTAATYTDRYCKLTIQDPTLSTTYGTAEMHFGNGGAAPTDTPVYFGQFDTVILDAGNTPVDFWNEGWFNTPIVGLFEDKGARLVSAAVYEESIPGDTFFGLYSHDAYLYGQPILATDRSFLLSQLQGQWKHGAAQLTNFSVDRDSSPLTRTSATPINIVDNSSTAVSASSPGFTLDLANRSTTRRVTVPVTVYAFGKVAGGAGGTVVIKDSGGTVKATVTITGASAAWYTTTCNLTAASGKHDLQFAGDGANQLTLYAVSAFQYEA